MHQPDPLDFAAVATHRRFGGWSADRQRGFIDALAETGCVSEACAAVGITARSAYRLRVRPDAAGFAAAWDAALTVAAHRLVTIAFERAVHGGRRTVIRDGVVVAESIEPSDRMLIFLLRHLDPMRFGVLAGPLEANIPDPRHTAAMALPKLTGKLTDIDAPCDAVGGSDLIDLHADDDGERRAPAHA